MEIRLRIILALKDLSRERGFYGTTVDELAAYTGMSKRTIYRYFQSKEEIIEAVMGQFMQETEQKINEILSSPTNVADRMGKFVILLSEKLRSIGPRAFGELQRYYPDIWEQVEQFRAQKIKNLTEIITAGIQEGYLKEINPTIVTAALLATVREVVNPNFILEHNLTPEEAFRSVMHTFLYGILA